jgi:hypothetical protein
MNLAQTIAAGFGGEAASSTMPLHGHPETPYDRKKQQKGPDKGGVAGARKKRRKTKTLTSDAAGGQSGSSSKVSRSYHVEDYMGRTLHKFRTKEEAEHASVGNRHTRVTTQVPADETTEVRDMIRKRPGDNQVRTFRRSLPYANPFPANQSGR